MVLRKFRLRKNFEDEDRRHSRLFLPFPCIFFMKTRRIHQFEVVFKWSFHFAWLGFEFYMVYKIKKKDIDMLSFFKENNLEG